MLLLACSSPPPAVTPLVPGTPSSLEVPDSYGILPFLGIAQWKGEWVVAWDRALEVPARPLDDLLADPEPYDQVVLLAVPDGTERFAWPAGLKNPRFLPVTGGEPWLAYDDNTAIKAHRAGQPGPGMAASVPTRPSTHLAAWSPVPHPKAPPWGVLGWGTYDDPAVTWWMVETGGPDAGKPVRITTVADRATVWGGPRFFRSSAGAAAMWEVAVGRGPVSLYAWVDGHERPLGEGLQRSAGVFTEQGKLYLFESRDEGTPEGLTVREAHGGVHTLPVRGEVYPEYIVGLECGGHNWVILSAREGGNQRILAYDLDAWAFAGELARFSSRGGLDELHTGCGESEATVAWSQSAPYASYVHVVPLRW